MTITLSNGIRIKGSDNKVVQTMRDTEREERRKEIAIENEIERLYQLALTKGLFGS